jgi:hypothetical protein
MSNSFTSNPPKTLLTISTGLLVLYWYQAYRHPILLYTAIGIGIIAITSQYLSLQIEKVWFGIAKVLGFIMPKIILSIVFFCFLWPIAQLSKLFRKNDALQLKNNSPSMFVDSVTIYDKQYFENMW